MLNHSREWHHVESGLDCTRMTTLHGSLTLHIRNPWRCKAFGLEEGHKEMGDGQQEVRKGSWLISGLGLSFDFQGQVHIRSYFFRDPATHAVVFGGSVRI